MTIYSNFIHSTYVQFFQGAQGGPTLRPLFIRRPAGLLGDGAHTVPPRAANVFHRFGGPPDGGPLLDVSLKNQRNISAFSRPHTGKTLVVTVLIRHFGVGLPLTGLPQRVVPAAPN